MKKLIRALLIAAAAVAVLVILKNEYARYLMSDASYGLQALISSADKAREETEPYDLYIGSSMFRQGLDIDILDENGGNNYILSYNGADLFLIYEEIVYLLENEVPIGHLYLDLYVTATQEDPWVEDTRLFLDTDLTFKLGLWSVMKESDGASLTDLWEMLVTSNNEKLLTWFVDYPIVNATFRNGGNLNVTFGASKEELDSQLGVIEHNYNVLIPLNSKQEQYLKAILELCLEEDISVTFIETPKYSTAVCEKIYTDVMYTYTGILKEYGAEYYIVDATRESVLYYLEADIALDEDHVVAFDNDVPDYFIDAIHLSTEGRIVYTKALTQMMSLTQ